MPRITTAAGSIDPYDGWMWVPGYTWAPAWVVWRGDAQNVGWFPMPPDDQFLAGVEVYRDDWDWNRGYFGYSDWYGPSVATGLLAAWTFVALDRFADRDYYRYAYDRPQVVNIVNNTTNITNYVTVNNRIVNRSIDVTRVEQASGRRIQRVEARNVVRAPIETVDRGRQIATRERERHGGDARAPARERVQRLDAAEARTPVRERRNIVRFQRDDQQQQAQQPNVQTAAGPQRSRGSRSAAGPAATGPGGRATGSGRPARTQCRSATRGASATAAARTRQPCADRAATAARSGRTAEPRPCGPS